MGRLSKSNQGFRSSDAFAVVALGLTTLGITLSILTEAARDDRSERAKFGAEALAHQMASTRLALPEEAVNSAKIPSSNRGPASIEAKTEPGPAMNRYEGALGLDPWGKAYRYKLLRSGDNKVLRIVVWSSGPDQIQDTNFADGDLSPEIPSVRLSFKGDDVGFVYQGN